MEKEKGNKKSVILIIVIIVLLAVIGVLAWMVLHPKQEEIPEAEVVSEVVDDGALAYDTGVVAMDEDSLQKAVDEMLAKEGTMDLDMQVVAHSSDGTNFTCSLANSTKNRYDMYMILFLDETQEEVYRSGLIPTGKRIDRFVTNRKIESGEHECTLVFVQVEDDHKTTHAKVNVGFELSVD